MSVAVYYEVRDVLSRMHHTLTSLDFDTAWSQMLYLLIKPSYVSKACKARKLARNHYHRNDAAFLLLQIALLVVTVCARNLTVHGITRTMLFRLGVGLMHQLLWYVVATLLLVGAVACFLTVGITQKAPHAYEIRKAVEVRYMWDVHANAYFTYFIWTHVFGFILLPFLLSYSPSMHGTPAATLDVGKGTPNATMTSDHALGSHASDLMGPSSTASVCLGNILFLIGTAHYLYATYRGYLDIPFLQNQQRFLYPVLFCILFYSWATFLRPTSILWYALSAVV